MESKHLDFSLKVCPNTDYPYIGATPNDLTSCVRDLLKSSVLLITRTFTQLLSMTIMDDSFYLHSTGSNDFRVQWQLAVCEKSYCDFVCWTLIIILKTYYLIDRVHVIQLATIGGLDV